MPTQEQVDKRVAEREAQAAAALEPKESWEEKFYTLAEVFTEESALTIHLLHKLKLSYNEAVADMNKEVTGKAAEGLRVVPKKIVGEIIDGTYNKETKEPAPKPEKPEDKEWDKKKTPEEALKEFEAFKKALNQEYKEDKFKKERKGGYEIPVEEKPSKKGPIEFATEEKFSKEQAAKLQAIIDKATELKPPPSKVQDWDAEKGAWKKKSRN